MEFQDSNEIQEVNTKQRTDLTTQNDALSQKVNELTESTTTITAERDDLLKDKEYLKKDIERNNEFREKLDKQVCLVY
jgi:CHASE3 domain sensor protein